MIRTLAIKDPPEKNLDALYELETAARMGYYKYPMHISLWDVVTNKIDLESKQSNEILIYNYTKLNSVFVCTLEWPHSHFKELTFDFCSGFDI